MSRNRKISSKRKNRKESADKVILFFAIFMAIFGAIMIFDASVYKANATFGDSFYFLKSQIIWLILGTIPAVIIYYWDYRKLLKLSLPILVITIILLVLVLIFGEEKNGARRWFAIGGLPPIQPAEFAKLSVILYLTNWLSHNKYFKDETKVDFKTTFLPTLISFGAIVGVVSILVMLERDLGTTLIIAITSFALFFIGRDGWEHAKYVALTVLGGFVPLVALAAILEPYRLKRVSTYLHLLLTGEVADIKETGYQIHQILIGIGSGGIVGKGFGQSRQRFGYLVENTAFTDSIFAVILEELGFIGGTFLVFAWVFFLWRGFKIAQNAPDKEGRLLAIGISVWITLQALMNMAANVGLIPLTGIPAPLLSYGGSSTIVTLIGIGILLNISRCSVKTNGG